MCFYERQLSLVPAPPNSPFCKAHSQPMGRAGPASHPPLLLLQATHGGGPQGRSSPWWFGKYKLKINEKTLIWIFLHLHVPEVVVAVLAVEPREDSDGGDLQAEAAKVKEEEGVGGDQSVSKREIQ